MNLQNISLLFTNHQVLAKTSVNTSSEAKTSGIKTSNTGDIIPLEWFN